MRTTWSEYFLEILHALQKRATCDRGRCAALIVKDTQILATGYVGSPKGQPHCDEVGHEMDVFYRNKILDKLIAANSESMEAIINLTIDGKEEHCIRTCHSEINAICNAAKLGHSIDGATIYVSMFPCYTCAKAIINCGIVEVIAENEYQSSDKSKVLFKECGIKFTILNNKELY